MAEEIGTRDVLEQIDARLDRMERSTDARFDRIDVRFDRMEARFERSDDRFDALRTEIAADRRWMLGLIIGSWITLMTSIWLKS